MPHRIYERMNGRAGRSWRRRCRQDEDARADDRADARLMRLSGPSSRSGGAHRRFDSAISCATVWSGKDSWGIGALFSRPVPWQQGFSCPAGVGAGFPHRRQSSMRRRRTTSRQRLRLTPAALAGRLFRPRPRPRVVAVLALLLVVLVLIIVVALALGAGLGVAVFLVVVLVHLREESFLSFSSSSSSTSGKSSSSSSAAPFSPSSSSSPWPAGMKSRMR